MDLFEYAAGMKKETGAPLASRIRPRTLEEVVGHLWCDAATSILYSHDELVACVVIVGVNTAFFSKLLCVLYQLFQYETDVLYIDIEHHVIVVVLYDKTNVLPLLIIAPVGVAHAVKRQGEVGEL